MTELSFLIELLLNHKLPKLTRDAIAQRIRAVETQPQVQATISRNYPPPVVNPPPIVQGAPQAASTLRAMARHGDIPAPVAASEVQDKPVEVIAQTPATAAAMQARAQAISAAIAGGKKGATHSLYKAKP